MKSKKQHKKITDIMRERQWETLPDYVREKRIHTASGENTRYYSHKFCRGGGGNNFHCGCKYNS